MIIRGKREEVFEKIGREHKDVIKKLVDYIIKEILYKKIENNFETISKSMALTKKECPNSWQDLEVLSNNANISIEDLFYLNTMSDLIDLDNLEGSNDEAILVQKEGCTSLWKREFLAQNWDFNSVFQGKNLVVVIEDEKGKVAFLTYFGGIGLTGFNDRGIGICTNKVCSKKTGIGIGYPFYIREVLSKNTFDEVVNWIINKNTISGRSLLIADFNGRMCNVESAAKEKEILIMNGGYFAHTNHYLSNRLRSFERKQAEHEEISTKKRLAEAEKTLKNKNLVSLDYMKNILSLHGDYGSGSGICTHDYHGARTCGSVIMNLKIRNGWFYLSNPCSAKKIEINL